MTEYKIYANRQGTNEAVKQGWSWPAFLFHFIWALVKKMWVLGGTLLAFFFFMGMIEVAIETSEGKDAAFGLAAFMNLFAISVAIVFGVNGNKWREKKLQSRGFEYQDSNSAANPEAAIAQWIKASQETQDP